MNHLVKFILFTFCLVISSGIIAQEKTAAGVYNEGLTLLKAKNYVEGLALMEEAITLSDTIADEKVLGLAKKNGSVAAGNLGNTSYKAKDYDTALMYYQKGQELNPASTTCAIGKARVLDKQEKFTEAVVAFLSAGNLYQKSTKKSQAEKSYKSAQNIVGKLYVGKEYSPAIEAGEAFLGMMDNAEVRYYMARCFNEAGENEVALEHINKAVEMASAKGKVDDKYHMAQGESLEDLGRTGEALAAYQKVKGAKYKAQAEYKIGKLKA